MATGAPHPRLVGDIGGTPPGLAACRIRARASRRSMPPSATTRPDWTLSAARYLHRHGCSAPVGRDRRRRPVDGDVVAMTHRLWTFSISDMRRRLVLDRLLVLNDYAALAHAPGSLRPDEGRTPVVGEGGHVSLSAADDREDRVVAILRRRFDHVPAEWASPVGPRRPVGSERRARWTSGRAAAAFGHQRERVSATTQTAARRSTCSWASWQRRRRPRAHARRAAASASPAASFVQLGDMVILRERFEARGRYQAYRGAIPTSVRRRRFGAGAARGRRRARRLGRPRGCSSGTAAAWPPRLAVRRTVTGVTEGPS